ncbi:MAG: InlB B-repeat-containing protein [Clostridia bacterium]|nr:InlB B-repeat-containing protein [Clostridia bacterium]
MKRKVLLSVFSFILMFSVFATLNTTYAQTDFETGDEVYFGSYPVSVIKDQTLIASLGEIESEWKTFNYSYGNGRENSAQIQDYAHYTDIYYGGIKYRGIKFDKYRPKKTNDVPEESASAQSGNGYTVDTVYWFEYEPLVWNVIDKDNGIILCDRVIDAQPFNEVGLDNNYLNSELRQFLNDEFYNSAFTSGEKEYIVRNSNDDFVSLAKTEYKNNNLIPDAVTGFTDYALCNGLVNSLNINLNKASCNWFLRDNREESDGKAAAITFIGQVGAASVNFCYGVRPAIMVNLKETNKFSLSYFVNGAEAKCIRLSEGEQIESYIPQAPEGYTFDGWVPEEPKNMPGNNLKLEAKFTVNKHKVLYLVDGIAVLERSVNFGDTIPRIDNPEKEGFIFSGWDTDIPDKMPDRDLVFNAVWVSEAYKAAYYSDNLLYSEYNVKYGDTVPEPYSPVKTGYTFAGWDREIPGNMPATDIIFNAVWKKTGYTVQFIDSNGSVLAEYTVEYGNDIPVPDAPLIDGYSFISWDKDVPEKMPDCNLTFTAIYEKSGNESTVPDNFGNKDTGTDETGNEINVIIKNCEDLTVGYRATVIFHAEVKNTNINSVVWYDENGEIKGTGERCIITSGFSYRLRASVIGNDGVRIYSPEQAVKVKDGLLDRFISVFARIFRSPAYIIDRK